MKIYCRKKNLCTLVFLKTIFVQKCMKFPETILRGIGQVMFQNNWLSGLLVLAGIFYNSWMLGLAAIAGTCISTISAQILNYSKVDIQNGLYGFNGTLTGIAVLCFFEVSPMTVGALIVGATLSTLVMRFLKKILPPFTAPFVMVTWLLIYSLLLLVKLPLLSSSLEKDVAIAGLEILSAFGKSFGQVMFQENTVTGLLFLVAIFINNQLNAVYAMYAAILGWAIGWLFSESLTTLNAGLMGYNAILCAIALSGKNRMDFLWISLAIILSTVLNIGLARTGIITLTAPFVAATLIILMVKNRNASSKNRSSAANKLQSL